MKMIVGGLLLSLVFGCATQEESKPAEPQGTVIARVGNSVLTLEELLANIPVEYRDVITHEQNVQYVRQWVDTELLFNEALRLEIDREPEIKSRLEKMRRDLLSAEVINRVTGQRVSVSDDEIREYYELHRTSFVRPSFTIRYDDIIVDDVNLAWQIRNTATHENFRELAKEHSKNPQNSTNGSSPYVPIEQIPEPVRGFLMAARVPSITGPYRSREGTKEVFHILRTLGKFDRGSIASLDEVQGEIVARLSTTAQQNETTKLIEDIRSRTNVELYTDRIAQSGGAQTVTTVDTTAAEQE